MVAETELRVIGITRGNSAVFMLVLELPAMPGGGPLGRLRGSSGVAFRGCTREELG
jgi:hypothetical protein